MHKNNIRKLRKAKGVTLERLEELSGISYSYLSRLQSGERPLSLRNAELIAEALGTSAAQVLGIPPPSAESGPGQSAPREDEMVRVDVAADDPLRVLVGRERYLMEVRTNALERLGIFKGDLALIDESEDVCENPPPLRPVLILYHPTATAERGIMLLRQFVPPSLLITNSRDVQLPNIDLEHARAEIRGVVVRTHRRY